tara:strand:+ start:979 stop:1368 length:390 start_codon:yes stop_codon:yes gene_type:complete
MQTMKRMLTDEHPDTLTSMACLASTYWNQGRWKEAEELEVQVMETSKRVLTDEHPATLTSMNNLAFTLQSQARREEALALMERCFQLREQVLGEQHPTGIVTCPCAQRTCSRNACEHQNTILPTNFDAS